MFETPHMLPELLQFIRIRIEIHTETGFRFSEKVHAISESDNLMSDLSYNATVVCFSRTRITLFTAKTSFDLPSTSG